MAPSDYKPPFSESISENTIFSVSGMGFLRRAANYSPSYARAIISNAGFFMLDSCEDDSDFTCIGDLAGLYGNNGSIQIPAMYARPVLIVRETGAWEITRFGYKDMLLCLPEGRTLEFSLANGSLSGEGIQVLTRLALHDKFTPVNPDREEFAFCGRYPVCYKRGGGLVIPNGGLVLSFRKGTQKQLTEFLHNGGKINYSILPLQEPESVVFLLQGAMHLIQDGNKTDIKAESETFLPDSIVANTVPRTFHTVIADPTKARLLVAIDRNDRKYLLHLSRSSVYQAQNIGLDMGYQELLLLDCGGSAQLFHGSGAICPSSDQRDTAWAHFDRPVPLALIGE